MPKIELVGKVMRIRYIAMPLMLFVCVLVYRVPRLHHARKKACGTKTIFIFMGKPGSGKSTLAEQCKNVFHYKIFCPDSTHFVSKKAIEQWLLKNLATEQVVVLDGYPRSIQEAKHLHNFINRQRSIHCKVFVVKVDVPNSEASRRISERLICSNHACQLVYSRTLLSLVCPVCQSTLTRRNDDCGQQAQKRMQAYLDNETYLAAFYGHQGYKVAVLSGDQPHCFALFDQFKKIARL